MRVNPLWVSVLYTHPLSHTNRQAIFCFGLFALLISYWLYVFIFCGMCGMWKFPKLAQTVCQQQGGRGMRGYYSVKGLVQGIHFQAIASVDIRICRVFVHDPKHLHSRLSYVRTHYLCVCVYADSTSQASKFSIPQRYNKMRSVNKTRRKSQLLSTK